MPGFSTKNSNRQSSFVIRHSNRPLAAVAFSFSLGIAFSLICHEYSFSCFAAADICLIFASYWALRRDQLVVSLMVGLAAVSLGGLLMALAHRDGFSSSDLRALISQNSLQLNEPSSFEGCVVRESEERNGESVAIVELCGILQKDRWIGCTGKGILRISKLADTSEDLVRLMRGDRIRGWAVWRIPRNYENPGSADRAGILSRRGIFLVGRVKSPRLLETLPGGCSNPWTELATSISNRVRTSIQPINEWEDGQPAAILASLVVGDYSGLRNTTREAFQNSGSFHVLVVSGLHVAWIAGLLLQFLKFIRMPERARYLLAALVILLYTCVVGFQASITRCLWVFILYLTGRMIFRRADSVNLLLASALILLAAQPDWLFETGFQFSFLSVMAIAMTAVPFINAYVKPVGEPLLHCGDSHRLFMQPGPWYRRGRRLRLRCEILIEEWTDARSPAAGRVLVWIGRGIAGAGLAIGSMIVATLSVQLWLEPLLAYSFNRMSWISPVANLVIVPFSSVVLAAGILAALASGLSCCGPALIRLAGSLASLLLSSAEHITMVPGAWQRCPTPSPGWILAGILLLFVWSFFELRKSWIPCIYVAILLACVSFGSVPVLGGLLAEWRSAVSGREEKIWTKDSPVLSFTFLDVGEGDSAVIRFPNGRIWALDAGGLRISASWEDNADSFDIGEAVVSRYLWHSWITGLDRLILSHTDMDHAGGVPALMKNFRISRFDHSQVGADAILGRILRIARERQINVNVLQAGMEENEGSVTVRALHPPMDSKLASANENSIVLEFSYGHFSALLTGDLEKSGEAVVLSRKEGVRGQLLKVAHHGSRFGTSEALLARVRPRWAVISVGRTNPFGHPSSAVIVRLLQHGVKYFLTLDDGAVTFETNGTWYLIRSHIRGTLEQGNLDDPGPP